MEFWISSPLCFGFVVRSTAISPTLARAETDTPTEIATEIRLVSYPKVYSGIFLIPYSVLQMQACPHYGGCGS